MPIHDELGKRMKQNYEQIPKTKLMKRCPTVVRLDGRSFHNFTKGLKRPFDDLLITSMQETMKYLCENIQGCVLGYQQSDEISLLLVDYQKLTSQAFFDYEVQKVCSITASMTTMIFNKIFSERVRGIQYYSEHYGEFEGNNEKYIDTIIKAMNKGAMFDSRCFNIPKEEVANYFYWRQLDAVRNSIQMVGQANFSHKELHQKSCNNIQEMLHEQKGINWNDYPTHKKRGSCCIKKKEIIDGIERSKWVIDTEIPNFVNEGREYIERLI